MARPIHKSHSRDPGEAAVPKRHGGIRSGGTPSLLEVYFNGTCMI